MKLERATARFAGVAAAAAAAVLLTGMLARLPAAEPDATARIGGTTEECTVREVARRRLTVEDSLELYVEPVAFVASGKRVLLAGTPNYLWGPTADGGWRRVARDSVFGVVTDEEGHARTIRSPITARLLDGIRALPREDGGWDVVFAELDPWDTFPPPNRAGRLWHGVFDGKDWTFLHRLPVPSGSVMRPFNAPSLLRRGDTLAWALASTSGTGDMGVTVFKRTRDRWSATFAPVGPAAYAALSHSDTAGLLLGVVQPDTTLMRDGNSLILYGERNQWQRLRRIVRGSEMRVGRPAYDSGPGGTAFGWIGAAPEFGGAGRAAYVLEGGLEAPPGRVTLLGPGGAELVLVSSSGGEHLWAMDTQSERDGRQLRFVRQRGDSVLASGGMAHPFYGGFNAVAASPSEILLTGPVLDQSKSTVVSLLLHVRMTCS